MGSLGLNFFFPFRSSFPLNPTSGQARHHTHNHQLAPAASIIGVNVPRP